MPKAEALYNELKALPLDPISRIAEFRPVSRPGSILFLTQTAHPWGGVENWLEYLVPGLDKLGWNVTVGLVRGRRHHNPAEYLKIHPYPNTVAVPARDRHSRGGAGEAPSDTSPVKQPDIVVPVNVADTLEAVRRVKAAGQKVRILYPLHGDLPDYLLDVANYKGCLDYAVATNRRGLLALERVGGLAPERTAHVAYGASPPPARHPPRSKFHRAASGSSLRRGD